MSWRAPRSTTDIRIPSDALDRIVGQDAAIAIVRLALRRKAHLLLIGPPGVGKSLLAAAYAEHAAHRPAEDIVARANPARSVAPLIERYPRGEGARAIERERRERVVASAGQRAIAIAVAIALALCAWLSSERGNVLVAVVCAVVAVGAAFVAWRARASEPHARLLVSHTGPRAPFVDATGFRESALLGDVRHDPHQSGSGRTPPHELLEPGAIHEAHGGVLLIDEASTLSIETQQRLLSALQNKSLPIVGRNAGSSGTMIRSDALPCDVAFVLAGSSEEIETLHAALRSRIRGYGYEIHMETTMADTPANRDALARFVATELALDADAPPCDGSGINEIVAHAAVMSGRPEALSLRLRDLGGIVRSAADIAVLRGDRAIGSAHVSEAIALLGSTGHAWHAPVQTER